VSDDHHTLMMIVNDDCDCSISCDGNSETSSIYRADINWCAIIIIKQCKAWYDYSDKLFIWQLVLILCFSVSAVGAIVSKGL